MIGKAIARIYRGFPIVRELLQIRDALRHEVSTLKAVEIMRDWELELAQTPRFAEPLRLARYSFQVNSQSGQDGIIREIFRRIGTTSRVFVEVGVEDGTETNTTFLLAQGWRGYWIDSGSRFQRTLSACRIPLDRLRGTTAFVRKENAASLLQQLGVPQEFDLLAVDIDQNTYYVWEGLRAYRPRVAVIEYNAALPPDLDWKVSYDGGRVWDGTQNFGASLKALERLGAELGYALVGCDLAGTDSFFVRSDLVEGKFAAPYTAENHYEPIRYAMLHRRGHPRAILDLSDSPRR